MRCPLGYNDAMAKRLFGKSICGQFSLRLTARKKPTWKLDISDAERTARRADELVALKREAPWSHTVPLTAFKSSGEAQAAFDEANSRDPGPLVPPSTPPARSVSAPPNGYSHGMVY